MGFRAGLSSVDFRFVVFSSSVGGAQDQKFGPGVSFNVALDWRVSLPK